jgi:hypothetical protein
MIFNELSEDNFLLFAIKNYENPQAVTREDFDKDLNHFKYIKRLLKTFIVFLDKLPDYPKCYIHEIPIDRRCLAELNRISNEKN